MPTIEFVEIEKITLEDIFNHCGVIDIEFEALRMEGGFFVSAQQAWENRLSRKSADESIGVDEYFALEDLYDDVKGNYLYLVPNRKLLKAEWELVQPFVQFLMRDPRSDTMFASGIRVITEDNAVHTLKGPNPEEDGRKRQTVPMSFLARM